MPSKKAMEQASKGLATFSKQSDYLQEFIRKARERKPGASPQENIIPNLADYVPLPKDIDELYSTIKLVSQDPKVRKEVLKEVRRGFADVAKDPVGTAKKLAKENPVDAAAFIATGGLAGLKKASYALPLHVRSYLRAMGHLPGTSKHLPKRYQSTLEKMIIEELETGFQEGPPPMLAKEFARYGKTLTKLEKKDPGGVFNTTTDAEELVRQMSPPVEELLRRGKIKKDSIIVPLQGTAQQLEEGIHGSGKLEDLYRTLGKYYLAIDPKTQKVKVVDLYKFYDIFRSSNKKETLQEAKNFVKRISSGLSYRLKHAKSFSDRKAAFKELKDSIETRLFHNTVLPEKFGIAFGGDFPIEYKISKATQAKIRKLIDNPDIEFGFRDLKEIKATLKELKIKKTQIEKAKEAFGGDYLKFLESTLPPNTVSSASVLKTTPDQALSEWKDLVKQYKKAQLEDAMTVDDLGQVFLPPE